MKFSRPLLALLSAVCALALLATACGGTSSIDEVANEATDESTDQADSETEAIEPETDEPEPEPEEAPAETEEAEEPEPTPTAIPEPPAPTITFWSDVLVVGDCFNRDGLTGELGEVPETVSCNELHEEEIYAVGQLDDAPGTPYAGDDPTADRAWDQLCDAATAEFAGRPFGELPFGSVVLFPTEEEWDLGDRGIMCAAASNEDGRQKIGTAAGGTLSPDEDLVVRIALATPEVGEFEDWGVINRDTFQGDAISLTAGDLDLQLRRPSALSTGILFDATPLDAGGFATTTTTIDLSTGEIGEIPVPVEGFEYSSTVGYSNSLVFAARESDNADWNLFATTSGGSATAIGDTDADEHYPTLSTDGQTVVFHRDGDLWRSSIDGADQLQLTDTDANEFESEISPDGEWIVFVSDRAGSDDLWLMTIDGDELTQLTDHPADDIWPTWSPDGSTIFFSSDRFSPELNHQTIMAMQPGDALPSYFSTFANTSHPLVIDSTLAANSVSVFPTLDERYFGPGSPGADSAGGSEVIAGEPGTLTTWQHSSGQLVADLPAGWTVIEDDAFGSQAFLAAPDIDAYYDRWGADAVYVSLHDSPDVDTFVNDVVSAAELLADSSCDTEVDNTGGLQTDGDRSFIGAIHDCGEGSNASYLGFYDRSTGLGVLIEGQRDNLPDSASDTDLLDAIAASVGWG